MMQAGGTLADVEDLALKFEETAKMFTQSSNVSNQTQACLAVEQGHQVYPAQTAQQLYQATLASKNYSNMAQAQAVYGTTRHNTSGGNQYAQVRPGDIYNQNQDRRVLKCTHCGILGHSR